MLNRVKDEINNAQARIREFGDNVAEQADELLFNARHRAHLAKGEGKQRLWSLETQALDWADDVMERTEEVKGTEKIRESFGRLVQERKDFVFALPIEDYTELNARGAASAVRGLDWVGLLQIGEFERENKARKTVFEAIERRQTQLEKPPFREAKVA